MLYLMSNNHKMQQKRFFTYPCGHSVIIMLSIGGAFIILLAGILFPAPEAWGVLGISLFIWLLVILYKEKEKCLNSIIVDSSQVKFKNKTYLWNEVYITMTYYHSSLIGRGYACLIYFSDHYLTNDELKKAHKTEFFIALTKKRAEYILKFYNKEIKIEADWHPYYHRKLLAIIESHNEKIEKGRE